MKLTIADEIPIPPRKGETESKTQKRFEVDRLVRSKWLQTFIPNSDGTFSQALTNCQLQEEDRQALQKEHDKVRNLKKEKSSWGLNTMNVAWLYEKSATAILLGEIREAPNISKSHGIPEIVLLKLILPIHLQSHIPNSS